MSCEVVRIIEFGNAASDRALQDSIQVESVHDATRLDAFLQGSGEGLAECSNP
jgi:hypothetical protein